MLTQQRTFRDGDDLVRFLTAQHRRLAHLFQQTAEMPGPDRQIPFLELRRLLAVHSGLEQLIVHPRAITALEHGADWVRARNDEEAETRNALALLERLPVMRPEFDSLLQDLRFHVLEHDEIEERDEFERVAPLLDPETLERVGDIAQVMHSLLDTPAEIDDVAPSEEAPAEPLGGSFQAMAESVRAAANETN